MCYHIAGYTAPESDRFFSLNHLAVMSVLPKEYRRLRPQLRDIGIQKTWALTQFVSEGLRVHKPRHLTDLRHGSCILHCWRADVQKEFWNGPCTLFCLARPLKFVTCWCSLITITFSSDSDGRLRTDSASPPTHYSTRFGDKHYCAGRINSDGSTSTIPETPRRVQGIVNQ